MTSMLSMWDFFYPPLIAGSVAGICVDGILFPLDTIKTRLQSSKGFYKSGGLRSIYKGITPALIGSAPGAALFFSTYTMVKVYGSAMHLPTPVLQMMAACTGETVACLVRVPIEVIKQRSMVSKSKSPLTLTRLTYQSEGMKGFYRGYVSTVAREIPFSIIQFPLWEYLKLTWTNQQASPVLPWQSSICGAVAGGIAAALTTPLDVAKTRIILAKHTCELSKGNVMTAMKEVYTQKGIAGLFDGVVPRVMWISMGGAIFLGVYDKVMCIIT